MIHFVLLSIAKVIIDNIIIVYTTKLIKYSCSRRTYNFCKYYVREYSVLGAVVWFLVEINSHLTFFCFPSSLLSPLPVLPSFSPPLIYSANLSSCFISPSSSSSRYRQLRLLWHLLLWQNNFCSLAISFAMRSVIETVIIYIFNSKS
jgi:hypothetical protein